MPMKRRAHPKQAGFLRRFFAFALDGRPHLGWYQAFERTHGYMASTLAGSVGFLQVLWDREGLTMHGKIAGTTVVRWKKSVPPPGPAKSDVSRSELEDRKNDPETGVSEQT